MENSFEKSGINIELIKGLEKQGITTPTEIQSIIVNPFMEGKDIVGMSYTGSGKTQAQLTRLAARRAVAFHGENAVRNGECRLCSLA